MVVTAKQSLWTYYSVHEAFVTEVRTVLIENIRIIVSYNSGKLKWS